MWYVRYSCGMGKRTSVYLSDALYEAWRASGVPLSELVRQALDAGRDDLALRIGRAALGAMEATGYATPGGTTATEVPLAGHATPGGTGTTPSGTSEPGTVKTAATKRSAPNRPAAEPAELAGIPLTVASALPRPQRCTHPGKRSVGGWCKDCDHLIEPGGKWA